MKRIRIDGVRRAHYFLALLGALATGCVASAESDGYAGDTEAREGTSENRLGSLYKVGPTRTYKDLGAVASMLAPGDVVEVDGNATYGAVKLTKHGTADNKITIRGVRINGKRPVFSGGYNTIELVGNNTVLEGIDVTGGSARCVFHRAHNITIRDSVVHHCPQHGILGADAGSGSLTLEYVEVYESGYGGLKHPIYMATDETAHPGSVFRMRHCYVHDGNGGNAVKTRAERNEIYYNWIEGASSKELELIGPDGQSTNLAREDSDVVGNVFRKTNTTYTVRVGGDGTGYTNGRYRFVNNTFLLASGSSAAIWAFDGLQSIEMHNNVFYRVGGGSVQVLRNDGKWTTGSPILGGSRNWVPVGSSYPSAWTGTLVQTNPGFVNVSSRDVRLLESSPLINAGTNVTASPSGYAFPSPLALPLYHPPRGVIEPLLGATARPVVGTIDIGAFEFGTSVAPSPAPEPTPEPEPVPGDPTCRTGSLGVWQNTSFPAKTGVFTATWNVTPSTAPLDGAVALSDGARTTWTGLAAIVRFNPNGVIDVRNGSTYQAATVFPYAAGVTYKIRMVVDVPNKKYSAFAQAPGATEKQLAGGYAFRTEQAAASVLSNWVVNQVGSAGSLTACGFAVQ